MIDFKSEINVIHLIYIVKLDVTIRKTDIIIKKIDKLTLKTFEIVIISFLF